MKYDHNVLIVDDEVSVARVVAGVVKKLSVDSVYASDGTEALSEIENSSKPFSLIICDQNMPSIKGADLLERISHISPDTVRFLITGNADINTIIQAVNKGKIHKYIQKPCQVEQLFEDIKAGLKQYELNVEYEELFRMAKEQNAKLYALNRDLKQSAGRQTKTLAALEEELRQAHGKTGIGGPLSNGVDELSPCREISNHLKARSITDDKKMNPLFAAAVAELYCRFQEIALKNGFRITLKSK